MCGIRDGKTLGAYLDRRSVVSAWSLPKSSLRLRPEPVVDSIADVLKSVPNRRSEVLPYSSGAAFESATRSPSVDREEHAPFHFRPHEVAVHFIAEVGVRLE